MNTAHLPEEKKRGMTIDLGYAYLPLKRKCLGLLMYLAMKVSRQHVGRAWWCTLCHAYCCSRWRIAAQTKEHLAILRQLQFTEIMVVITKADRATNEQIEGTKNTNSDRLSILS